MPEFWPFGRDRVSHLAWGWKNSVRFSLCARESGLLKTYDSRGVEISPNFVSSRLQFFRENSLSFRLSLILFRLHSIPFHFNSCKSVTVRIAIDSISPIELSTSPG